MAPLWSFFATAALTFADPADVVLHGPQSGTITGPALRFAPAWMCAATPGPLRCENVSFHVSVVPLSVALNDPPARGESRKIDGDGNAAQAIFDFLVERKLV